MNITYATVEKADCQKDSHFYFRGKFSLDKNQQIGIRLLGASVYEAWLDDKWLCQGPPRFDRAYPEYETFFADLEAGEHVIAMHVMYEGIDTRLLAGDTPLMIFCEVDSAEQSVAIAWKYQPLSAYRRTDRRLDCILGWVEWCDTRKLPEGWRVPSFDDASWKDALCATEEVETCSPYEGKSLGLLTHTLKSVAEGELVNLSATLTHDPGAGFFARQLANHTMPADGKWYRFDLGKVSLGRAEVTLEAPAGTVVQIAYAEFLIQDRVNPHMTQCGGDDSCNLDHFVLRGGKQTLRPLNPKGGRYIEVHVLGAPAKIFIEEMCFQERVYYPEKMEGAFSCGDELLNQIWKVGVETLRSCAEDAITDNPTRERGQWLGDAVGPGMDILAVSYADMRPLKRGLIQAAQCLGENGMIPAIYPGTRQFLPSFAIQWLAAIPHYFVITGDRDTLRTLYPAAVKNFHAFDEDLCDTGLCMNPKNWNFIDWGYRGSSTGFTDDEVEYREMDRALSLFYYRGLSALVQWASWLEDESEVEKWVSLKEDFKHRLSGFIAEINGADIDWSALGYHTAALALGSGLISSPASKQACVDFVKKHILGCFPNARNALRLSGVTVESDQLITPFFFHHVFPALVEAGEMSFVQGQMRSCWGWMLEEGVTTWLEVFDLRWSHCHQWSGCPTWILSRYCLGLHPRFDYGDYHYAIQLEAGELERASGVVPISFSDHVIHVQWQKEEDKVRYEVDTPVTIFIHLNDDEPIEVQGKWSTAFNTITVTV